MNALPRYLCLLFLLLFVGCTIDSAETITLQPSATLVADTPVPTQTATATIEPQPSNTPSPTIEPTTPMPTPMSEPTATLIPTPTPTAELSLPEDGHLIFLWSPEPPCVDLGDHAPNYGIYKASWENEQWTVELLDDGFYFPRASLSPNQRRLAIRGKEGTIEHPEVTCFTQTSFPLLVTTVDLDTHSRQEYPSHNSSSYKPVWDLNSQYMYVFGHGKLQKIDVASGNSQFALTVPSQSVGYSRASNSNTIAIATSITSTDVDPINKLHLLNGETGELSSVMSLPVPGTIGSQDLVVWSANDEWLAVPSTRPDLRLFFFNTLSAEIVTTTIDTYTIAWSPTVDLLAVGTSNSLEIVTPLGESVYRLEQQTSWEWSSSFLWSTDGTKVWAYQSRRAEQRGLVMIDTTAGIESRYWIPNWNVFNIHGWLGTTGQLLVTVGEFETPEEAMSRCYLAAYSVESGDVNLIFELTGGTDIPDLFWINGDQFMPSAIAISPFDFQENLSCKN